MSNLEYPKRGSYKLPEKNVLVISCIDLRLTDNLVKFLDYDNLANRYDHYIMAGASLCALAEDHSGKFKKDIIKNYELSSWRTALFKHIEIAIALHGIKDVYIVEHENCGAYKEFLKDGVYPNYEKEKKGHAFFAHALATDIEKKYNLHVNCFIMDLRGNVDHISPKKEK